MVNLIKNILIYICYFLCFCLIYILIFRKWIFQKYRFEIMVGKPRSGKTTLMTKDAIKSIRKHIKVYCNVKLDVPGVRLFNANNIGQGFYFDPGSLILIDEPNLLWDNRTFKDKNRISVIEWFRLYGHNQVNVKFYTQTFDVDKKLRYLASDIYLVQKFAGTISICRRLKKNITIKESAMDAESQIVDELKFVPIFYPGSLRITFIPRWTKYFDSFYLPSGYPMPYEIMERSPAANGQHNKRSLLDIFNVRRQHRKKSKVDSEIIT